LRHHLAAGCRWIPIVSLTDQDQGQRTHDRRVAGAPRVVSNRSPELAVEHLFDPRPADGEQCRGATHRIAQYGNPVRVDKGLLPQIS
jgi:hypothetical protein